MNQALAFGLGLALGAFIASTLLVYQVKRESDEILKASVISEN